MLRFIENLLVRTDFHNFSAIHDGNAVAQTGDDTQIMGNHDDGGTKLFLHFLNQLQYLRLDGHVQRRCRFIGNDQLRIAGQRHRDDDTLTHAAGEFMRVLIHPLFR